MSKQINNLKKSLEEQLYLNEKQDKTDNNLETNDKTIVGAINEIQNSYATAEYVDDNLKMTLGDLTKLQTSNKTNLVGAINELFQNVDSGKQLIATAIDDNNITKDSTFDAMGTAITLLHNQITSLTNELAGKVTPVGTAVAGNVLSGKTFINSTGSTITGSMTNNGSKTITPSKSNQTLGAGYYSGITINGDADLVAANILSGKNIFGVAGSAKSGITGTVSNTTSTGSFTSAENGGATDSGVYYVQITFSFTPTTIVVSATSGSTNYISVYKTDYTICGSYETTDYKDYLYPYKSDSYIKTSNTVYKIPVGKGGITYSYYAF